MRFDWTALDLRATAAPEGVGLAELEALLGPPVSRRIAKRLDPQCSFRPEPQGFHRGCWRGQSKRGADGRDMEARLLLEDGRTFPGAALGKAGETVGEVVFNTAMSGYQEVITDPSYAGQLVAMTYPLIGNYGWNEEDSESGRPCLSGFIVVEAARRPSSWRSRGTLEEFLLAHDVVGIQDIDVRALTRHIRSRGAMRGGIAPASVTRQALMERIQSCPPMEGRNLAARVGCASPYSVRARGRERFHVAALDYGVKSSSPEMLSRRGCRVTVIPPSATVAELQALQPDGLFVSNGPGDPAAIRGAARLIRDAASTGLPIFGICLGHQLIAQSFGGQNYKLPFGHHGGNHPVLRHDRQTVEITSQNHGFAVKAGEDGVLGAPELRVTHTNLYDGTVAGLAHRSLPVFSVQYHPEAAPGPRDARYLFDQFLQFMEDRSAEDTG